MPRTARVIFPGCPHHVTQRGNNRQDVFFVDGDRQFFLGLLRSAAARYDVSIDGYCLMVNHIHLIATPRTADGLAETLKRSTQLYAQYVNRLHDRTGHLWQGRFYSSPLDEEHFWTALAYVENNPVRAGLVQPAWHWPWSSAAAHIGGKDPARLLNPATWTARLDPSAWQEVLSRGQTEETVNRVRLAANRGRPLGSDAFLAKLETFLGRRLRPQRGGRPKKKN
jgi:putative transposase